MCASVCVLTRCFLFIKELAASQPSSSSSPFLSIFCQALITNKEIEAMQDGGGAGCCGWMLVAVDKTGGGGDRKGVRGFRVNGLIDWSSPVHLLCLSIRPVESTAHSE